MNMLQNGQFTITEAPIEPELMEKVKGVVPPSQTLKFRLLDDDKEVYFVGYMKPAQSKVLFYPLDTLGNSYGCIELQVLELNKWETV